MTATAMPLSRVTWPQRGACRDANPDLFAPRSLRRPLALEQAQAIAHQYCAAARPDGRAALMASGAEHYLRAEQLLDHAYDQGSGPGADANIAAAKVHATLALAAATAYPAMRDWMGDEARDGRDWTDATAPTAVRP